MKAVKFTIHVPEDTIKRWRAAAAADQRSLSMWIRRRVDGAPGQTDLEKALAKV
jgi:predicted HicB family RNase H-like nuclease